MEKRSSQSKVDGGMLFEFTGWPGWLINGGTDWMVSGTAAGTVKGAAHTVFPGCDVWFFL